MLAMEEDYSLEVPAALIEEFQNELTVITQHFPYLATRCASLEWTPGIVSLELDAETLQLWQLGKFRGFDEIHERIGFTSWKLILTDLLQMYFDPMLHVHAVAEMYSAVDGVEAARPSPYGSVFCDHIDDITRIAPHTYEFYELFELRSCPFGKWTVEITEEGPQLFGWYPYPLETTQTSWGRLKSRF